MLSDDGRAIAQNVRRLVDRAPNLQDLRSQRVAEAVCVGILHTRRLKNRSQGPRCIPDGGGCRRFVMPLFYERPREYTQREFRESREGRGQTR